MKIRLAPWRKKWLIENAPVDTLVLKRVLWCQKQDDLRGVRRALVREEIKRLRRERHSLRVAFREEFFAIRREIRDLTPVQHDSLRALELHIFQRIPTAELLSQFSIERDALHKRYQRARKLIADNGGSDNLISWMKHEAWIEGDDDITNVIEARILGLKAYVPITWRTLPRCHGCHRIRPEGCTPECSVKTWEASGR